jgi:Fe-S cluster assembly scaffold protein SufB
MERPKTFEVATALIMSKSGKNKVSAMEEARDNYPDLFLEYSARVKSGGPDYFDALGVNNAEPPFETLVANFYMAGGSKTTAVQSACRNHPRAFENYLKRVRNGEDVRFTFER